MVMGSLSTLLKSRPPVVLMTGTCGPTMERPMLSNLDMKDVQTIRARTNRPEIMYTVFPGEPIPIRQLVTTVQKWYFEHLKARLQQSTSQVLIFVPLKVIGVQIAARLGLNFFESDTEISERQRMYEGFRNGTIQCLVATQAFGAGIDIGSIDVVVHAGNPRSMVDFSQESGRGGRHGQPALSIVFQSAEPDRDQMMDDYCGRAEMREWLAQTSRCRRIGLGEYLDGIGISCPSLPGGRLCDLCRMNGATETTAVEDMYDQLSKRPVDDKAISASATTVLDQSQSEETDVRPSGGSWATTLVAAKSGLSSPSSLDSPTSKRVPQSIEGRPSMLKTPVQSSWSITPKRKLNDNSTPSSDGSAKRRALLARMMPTLKASDISLDGPVSKSTVMGAKKRMEETSYADRLLPLLRLFALKKGVCFTCVGMGMVEKCQEGMCPVEQTMLEVEGESSMRSVVNKLADELKFEMPNMGCCSKCWMPAPRGESTNGFHPQGMSKNTPCLVFPMVATKALSCGSRLWLRKVGETPIAPDDDDPQWLVDLLKDARGVPESSIASFARILKASCGQSERWFIRVFYHMIKQAVETDDRAHASRRL